MLKLNAQNKRVLVIPDTHAPFAHPDALKFLRAVDLKYLNPMDLVIHLGDEIDGHCISMHDSHPDIGYSPSSEFEAAIKWCKQLEKIFPKMYLAESNHGSLVYRRAKKFNLPIHVIKSYQEVLGTHNWWWHESFLISTKMGDVYICHGKSSSTMRLAKDMGCNAIQGHYHGKQQIVWFATATGERYDAFGGCLIDREHLAFEYGKNHIPKPLLGCLLISKNGFPRMIKMRLNDKGRWDGKLP